jgi:hypothetical protein
VTTCCGTPDSLFVETYFTSPAVSLSNPSGFNEVTLTSDTGASGADSIY